MKARRPSHQCHEWLAPCWLARADWRTNLTSLTSLEEVWLPQAEPTPSGPSCPRQRLQAVSIEQFLTRLWVCVCMCVWYNQSGVQVYTNPHNLEYACCVQVYLRVLCVRRLTSEKTSIHVSHDLMNFHSLDANNYLTYNNIRM